VENKMLTIILSIITLTLAIATIYAKLQENETLQFIFKPLTMLAIVLIAISNLSNPINFYQTAILAGLIFSTIGDVFLIKDKQFFVQGLVAFLIGHICYIAAFWTNPNWLSLIFYLLYVIFFLKILWKDLGKLKIPVGIYATAIALMSWMALSKTIEHHNHHTLHAFLGSLMFVISDSLLAYNKFKLPFRLAPLFVLGTYFLAQWLIATSV
jgi:uncharacterized membrane protein YhhN